MDCVVVCIAADEVRWPRCDVLSAVWSEAARWEAAPAHFPTMPTDLLTDNVSNASEVSVDASKEIVVQYHAIHTQTFYTYSWVSRAVANNASLCSC